MIDAASPQCGSDFTKSTETGEPHRRVHLLTNGLLHPYMSYLLQNRIQHKKLEYD